MYKGDVVYYVDAERIGFGIVDEFTTDYAYVDLLELAEHRYVNGIPIDDFHSETKWSRLPKGWTYNTDLFTLEEKVPEAEVERRRQLRIDRPEDIRAALDEGILVKSEKKFHGIVEAEIDHGYYRIVKKYPHWTYTYGRTIKPYLKINRDYIHSSYQEAKRHLEGILEARRTLQSLSDEEWSWMEIRKVLKYVDEDYRKECERFLESLPDIWDVEIKKRDDMILWRRFEHRTEWTEIGRC